MIIFNTEDPLGRRVILKKDTWDYKICNYYNTNDNKEHGNSHPEMENLLHEVKKSVETPQYIIEDTKIILNRGIEEEVTNEARQEYIRFFFDDKDSRLRLMKTVVEFSDSDTGEIVTTHKIDKPKGIKKGGRILYDSTKK